MSRSERRKSKQNAKNFVPKKKKNLNNVAIIVLAVVAVVAWIAYIMARNSI